MILQRVEVEPNAVAAWPPAAWKADVGDLKDRGVPASDLVVFRFSDYGSAAYGSAIIVNPAFAAAQPAAVSGFLHAVIDGVKLAGRDPGRATDAVLARMDGAARDLELERLRAVLRDNIITDDVKRSGIGAISAGRFEASLDAIAEDYKFRRRPALPDIFDDSFMPPPATRKIN